MSKSYDKMFQKRSGICFFLIICFFFSCILRLTVIVTKDYTKVQAKQSALRLSAGMARGTIYDRNMIPITNSEKKTVAAVTATPRAITGISNLLSGAELESTLDMLKDGKPVLCEVENQTECDGIAFTEIFEHNSSETPSIHLIGYTDSDGHGVSGLEKAYDDILYCDGNVDFVYTSDGLGNVLEGITPTIENSDFAMSNGVITTLDINIQNLVEQSANKLKKGAVIVCESNSGKIRAITSRPLFDCTNIADYLEAKDSPLLNRATSAYNVGSVFKLCVAAAGLEKNISSHTHNCVGNLEIGNRFFNCHKRSGHGVVNITRAIALSCNTFFYTFGALTGGESIYKTASSLQFGRSIELCNGISTATGNLPSNDTLLNKGNLANFSIGQGQLLLSPVSLLNLYNSIASGGEYCSPTIVEATLKNGIMEEEKRSSPTKVMSNTTADILKNALIQVIEDGTAEEAKPSLTTAAGKTSTAQTGKYKGSVEINQSWFCGFFPADKPKYTVIVFSEDMSLQEFSCAQIFAEIADSITEYEYND